MKKLIELSKTELLSFIYNTYKDTDLEEECLVCAVCGNLFYGKYYYICDDYDSNLSDNPLLNT